MFEPGRRRADAFLVGGSILLALFAIGFFWLRTAGPSEAVTGVILSLNNSPGSEGESAIVGVRLSDAPDRRIEAPRRLVVGCRVGDEIELIRRKHYIEVSPASCFASK